MHGSWLMLATAASCECEGFVSFVVGSAVDGAAANLSVNLMLLLHLVSFSLLAFQLHLFFFFVHLYQQLLQH